MYAFVYLRIDLSASEKKNNFFYLLRYPDGNRKELIPEQISLAQERDPEFGEWLRDDYV